MCKLLSLIHVPPPSRQQMQLTANRGCDDIKAVNTLDMYARREELKKKINILRGDDENCVQ